MDLFSIKLWSLEFWLAAQLVFNIVFVFFIIRALKKIKQALSIRMPDMENTAKEAVEQMIATIEPVLKDAEKKSRAFSERINEKNDAVIKINESLDKRMISLNLLLSKVDALINAPVDQLDAALSQNAASQTVDVVRQPEKERRKYEKTGGYGTAGKMKNDFDDSLNAAVKDDVRLTHDMKAEEGYNQKEAIIRLNEKGLDAKSIAGKLSLPKGEVELVLELHKKMTGM